MSKVVDNEYNGKPMFTVRKTDDEGEPLPQSACKPLANMGIAKVTAIMNHLEEFKDFYEANKKS